MAELTELGSPAQQATIHRSSPLSHQVYAALCQRLAAGQLRPGERLVLEHVAQQLGVSPTPVREALNRLIQARLISAESGNRFQVVDLTPAYVTDTFFVRGALEGVAAELAAPRVTPELLAGLRRALARGDDAVAQGRYDLYTEADVYLHRTICAVAGNQVLAQELGHLQVHVDFIRVYSRQHAGDHIRLSQLEHWAVVDALQTRDPQAARRVMEDHIRSASRRIVELIDFDAQQVR
jgi:GntR family transcriptional regulator, rspAB operon transcriptional repressor